MGRRYNRVSSAAVMLALAILLASIANAAEERPNLTLKIELRPGPPIGQTPEAAAQSTPPQAVFEEGQPIDVAFTVTNRGTQPYMYNDRLGDVSGRMEQYAVKVCDEQGHVRDDPRQLSKWDPLWGGLSGGPGPLAPGASFTKHVYLNQWTMPLPPGLYTACGTYLVDRALRSYPTDPTLGFASAPVAFEIRRRDDMSRYINSLTDGLESREPEKREQTITYLGFTSSLEAVPYIISGFYDDSDNVAFEAYISFLYMRDAKGCADVLLKSWEDRGPAYRLQERLHNYQVPKERLLPGVLKALKSPHAKVRATAATCLGTFGDAAVEVLVSATNDPDASVRSAATAALCPYRSPAAIGAVLRVSHDPDEKVRLTAVDVLASSHGPAYRARLRKMLQDTPAVAHAVILDADRAKLTPDDLRYGLHATDDLIRIHTAVALFGLGDDSMRAVVARGIKHLTRQDQENVCWWLRSAAMRRKLSPPAFALSTTQIWIDWLLRKD